MMDVIAIVGTLVLGLATLGLVKVCEKLSGDKSSGRES